MIKIKTYYDELEAKECLQLLLDNNLDAKIKKVQPLVNHALSGMNQKTSAIEVLVSTADFIKAKATLKENALNQNLEPSEYLKEFSIEELRNVFIKADEWSEFDLISAKKLLEEKSHPIEQSEIEKLEAERLVELSQFDEVKSHWLIIAYAGIAFGGVLAIILGSIYESSTKALPNGTRVFRYSPSIRRHGKIIRSFGFVSLVIMGIKLWFGL